MAGGISQTGSTVGPGAPSPYALARSQTLGYDPSGGYQTALAYDQNSAMHQGLTPAQVVEQTPNGGTVTYGRDPRELLSLYSSMSAGSGDPTAPAMPSSGGVLPNVDEPSTNAAYERAKERVGQTNRASIDALRNVMASSGTLGSGRESRASASIINRGQGELAETERRQEESTLGRARDVTDRNFAAQNARDAAAYQGSLSVYNTQMNAANQRRQSILELAKSAY